MNKYIKPEINLAKFNTENVVTQASETLYDDTALLTEWQKTNSAEIKAQKFENAMVYKY